MYFPYRRHAAMQSPRLSDAVNREAVGDAAIV
jgi:hypothetical protein